MATNPFKPVVVAFRSAKPRDQGLTMIADWGMPLGQQDEVLSVSAPYIDLAKIAVGIAALLPTETLKAKIKSYIGKEIVPFPGGQFLEYSIIHDNTDAYFKTCLSAGFPCIEVSDNLLEIELDAKCALIETAIMVFGFRVKWARRRGSAPPATWPKMRPVASSPERNSDTFCFLSEKAWGSILNMPIGP